MLDCDCGSKLAIWIILSLITSRFCFDTKLTGSHLNLQFERIPTFCWQAVLVRVQQSFDSAALNANWIVFRKICPQKRQENEWMEINWIGLNLQAGNEGDIIKDCQPKKNPHQLIRFLTGTGLLLPICLFIHWDPGAKSGLSPPPVCRLRYQHFFLFQNIYIYFRCERIILAVNQQSNVRKDSNRGFLGYQENLACWTQIWILVSWKEVDSVWILFLVSISFGSPTWFDWKSEQI